jgi:hypothetical protein
VKSQLLGTPPPKEEESEESYSSEEETKSAATVEKFGDIVDKRWTLMSDVHKKNFKYVSQIIWSKPI